MTEFISRKYGDEGFEIIIKTDSREHYRAAEEFARRLIDHAKPMTNREKLVDLLANGGFIADVDTFMEIADHLIANGVTFAKDINVPGWIPVTERLPKGECIALGYQNEMLIGYIGDSEYSDTGYAAESDGEHLSDVTHWMPLPGLPEEVEQ